MMGLVTLWNSMGKMRVGEPKHANITISEPCVDHSRMYMPVENDVHSVLQEQGLKGLRVNRGKNNSDH